ncbi:hypothetical protein GCE86_04075 [Micromonospora terminaliae]|uniref:Glycosyltransferase n=1 Tax=Micromonospora terminaliae TaxID=1914461 RepID=A0AAJ2ZJL3_9ACTN|nr:hypothetical protein [Micromonospora terminaliae]NES31012.1 hypothetical protein [Micromonospora terminaliae]QGL46299.1 hypothetical protein GCE86_04075 [Micromonospora terminaliae]
MGHRREPADRRLAIGPANFAEQAYQWARAVERHLELPAVSFALKPVPLRGRGFQFSAHHRIPHPRLMTPWGRAVRLNRILHGATHLAVDGFIPLHRAGIAADLARASRQGIRMALIAHGSDIRDPDAHMARFGFSYYASAPNEWVDKLRRRSRRNRSIAVALALPLFVSTPDLLLDVPEATWLPLSVDVERWQAAHPALGGGTPTVLHRPSYSKPPIKGTDVIDPVLRNLAALGRIRYLAPEHVSHDAMPELVGQADIVVDQIRTGSYGVAAVEGLAAGRLVIGFLGPATRALMPEEPPIVDASPERFAAVMNGILDDPETFSERAAAGPGFVRRWHDGAASAAALKSFLA